MKDLSVMMRELAPIYLTTSLPMTDISIINTDIISKLTFLVLLSAGPVGGE